MLLLWLACARAPTTPSPASGFVLHDAHLLGQDGLHDVFVRDGRVAGLDTPTDAPRIDVAGRWLCPGAVDSHVHLAYLPEAEAMADGGIAVAVDLGAPLGWARPAAPRTIGAGPLLTAPGGYPTRSWGRDGYGLEVTDAAAAVRRVVDDGAKVVKVAITEPPTLDNATLTAIVAAAHAAGLPVVAHALGDAEAARAAAAGVDGLAHTPVEALSDATVNAWAHGFVISTLGAFGGDAVANLRRLRAAGATVLYGTDFGNTRAAGIDARELALLAEAGLDGAAIADALGPAPARVWAIEAGEVRVGAPADFVELTADPRVDPTVWASPAAVWLAGERR